jgi:4'-phosphopantetheinyl transferase
LLDAQGTNDGMRSKDNPFAQGKKYTDATLASHQHSPLFPAPAAACDVWVVSLLQPPQRLAARESLLSLSERERAAAFLLPLPRRQVIVARAALRLVLGRALGVPPAAVRFTLNAHGKPALDPAGALRFNVSHSGDLALIAVASGFDVGVDVEAHRRTDDLAPLAASILGPEDLARWRAAAAVEGAAAFYRIWTCKEAVAKAIGRGLALDFRALRISLAPGRAAAVAALEPAWGAPGAWSLRELETQGGYCAAVAAPTPGLAVTQRTLVL